MLKKIFSKKIVSLFAVFAICITSLSNIVQAASYALIDSSKKATLTIVEYENAYGEEKNSTENIPLSDVEITIYKLDDNNLNKEISVLENDIYREKINLESKKLTTGEDGTVQFTELELGRYLVVETKSPQNVSSKMESFLIDLPTTSEDGTGWNYDVTVYPKNITVYGNVLLTQYNKDKSETLEGVVWELQNKIDGAWIKYDYEGTLTTDSNGQISVNNLPAGEYRLIELQTLDGYILDKSDYKEFTISTENTNYDIVAIDEKLTIEKQVKMSEDYGKAVGAYITDTVEWKTTVEVPSSILKLNKYYITENVPEGLEYIDKTLQVYGVSENEEKLLELGNDYEFTRDGNEYKIWPKPSKIADFDTIYLTYKTNFIQTVEYGKELVSSATLTYSNNILELGECTNTYYTTDIDTAETHTGALLVLKTDSNYNPLSGAKFKISTTKENANNNIYVKDENGNDLVAISDEEGNVIFYGLKYGNDNESAKKASSKYYLTEVESPTYVENEETKHYNLLSDSVEVVVNANSGNLSENTYKIINKKGFTLPVTGAVGIAGILFIGATLIIVAIKLNKRRKSQ